MPSAAVALNVSPLGYTLGLVQPRDLTPVYFSIRSSAVNVCSLFVEAAPKREQVGRVVDAVRDDRGFWDQRTKLLPEIGARLWKKRIQGNAQGHPLLIEQPSNPRNAPIYGILTKRFVDDIGVPRNHIRSKIRAVPKTPYFNVENETDRDLPSSRPRCHMNGFSRQPGYPVAGIFTDCRACRNQQADKRQQHVNGNAERFPIVLRPVLSFGHAHDGGNSPHKPQPRFPR